MAIDELAKPAGSWCPECLSNSGCGIYGRRPDSCRKFACLWLEVPALPETCRPDRSKTVLVMDADGSRLMAHCDAADPLAWRRMPIYGELKRAAGSAWQQGVFVIAKAGQRMWLVTPTEDLDMGRIAAESPYRIDHLPDGDLMVSILPVSADSEASIAAPITRRLSFRSRPDPH